MSAQTAVEVAAARAVQDAMAKRGLVFKPGDIVAANTTAPERALPALSDDVASAELPRVEVIPIDAANDPQEPIPFVLEPVVPQGEVTLLAGHGGTGKSFLALVLCAHVALGRNFGPWRCDRPRPALFVSLEDGKHVLLHRLAAICKAYGIPPSDLRENLTLLDCTETGPLVEEVRNGGITAPEETLAVEAIARHVRPGALVVVDNASDALAASENVRAHVRYFVRTLRRRFASNGGAVLLLAHVNKITAKQPGTESYSGSTAWNNSVRSRLALLRTGPDSLTVTHEKANHSARPAAPLRLTIDGSGCPWPNAQAAETERDDRHLERIVTERRVLEVVAQAHQQGAPVPAAVAGSRPAAKVVHDLLGDSAITKADVQAALERLRHEGLIRAVTVTTAGRKPQEVLIPASAAEPAPNAPNAPNAVFGAFSAISPEAHQALAPNAPNEAGGTGDLAHSAHSAQPCSE